MATATDYRRLLRLKGYDGATDTQLDDAIAEARRRLVRDHRWSWLESTSAALSTTASDEDVSLAGITDLAHVDAVRVVDTSGVERETVPLPLQELRRKQTDYTTPGLPRYWTRRNGNLVLYPTPDRAYTLHVDYVAQPTTALTGTDADTIVPDALQDLIAWAAVPPLAFRQREAWAMQYAETQYKELLRLAISQDNVRQRQVSQQVRSGYWGRSDYAR